MDVAAALEYAWSPEMEVELGRVRIMKRHKQAECAAALNRLGATPPAHQSDVSKWENGVRPATVSRRRAVLDYIGPRAVEPPIEASTASSSFEDIVRPLTGERPMTDAQSQVRNDIQQRFRDGPPLSTDDGEVFRWLVRFHGLGTNESGV